MRVRGASDGGRTDAGDAVVKLAQEREARPNAQKDTSTACTAAPNEPFQGSDSQYRLLFESNPVPMWVFHRGTLRFLAVNHAAIQQYGYSEAEFLEKTIADIRPPETVPSLMMDLAQRRQGLQLREVWKHRRHRQSTSPFFYKPH